MNIHLIIDCNYRFQTKSCMQNIILYSPPPPQSNPYFACDPHIPFMYTFFLIPPHTLSNLFIYILFISEIKVHKIHITLWSLYFKFLLIVVMLGNNWGSSDNTYSLNYGTPWYYCLTETYINLKYTYITFETYHLIRMTECILSLSWLHKKSSNSHIHSGLKIMCMLFIL